MALAKQVSNDGLREVVTLLTGIRLSEEQLTKYNDQLFDYYSGRWCDCGWLAEIEWAMLQVSCSSEEAFRLAVIREEFDIAALYKPEEEIR